MALADTVAHTTSHDGTFSTAGIAAWDGTAAHTIAHTGVVSGGIRYGTGTTTEDYSTLLAANGIVVGGGAGAAPNTTGTPTWGAATGQGLVMAAGTATTDVAAMSLTRTNNNAAVATGVKWTFTDTTSATGFWPFEILGTSSGAAHLFGVNKSGTAVGIDGSGSTPAFASVSSPTTGIWTSQGVNTFFTSAGTNVAGIYATGIDVGATRVFTWNSASNFGGGSDTSIGRAGANQVIFSAGGVVANAGVAGAAQSRAEINKLVTAIANNTATATLTVTIPNGAHSAGGKIILKGAAGAGGAIGADEFTALIEYDWTVTRTAGVNAVATLSTALLTAITSSVAGGATPTIAAALSAIAGAVGATNTFTFNVTINALTGSSTNHTCFCYAVLLNDNASGVSIA